MKNYKRQGGYTLLEMSVVIALLSVLAVTQIEKDIQDIEYSGARSTGMEIYQYSNAVRNWITGNPGISGGFIGTNWLKDSATCAGGTASQEYLPCNFRNETNYGKLTYATNIVIVGTPPAHTATATTTMSAFVLDDIRPDLSGLAAITAAGGYSYDLMTAMATTSSTFTSDPDTAVITIQTTSAGVSDPWLRIDGGNSMVADVKFSNANPNEREITGVSRLFNLAGQSLKLGNGGGASSMSFTLGDGVVVDSDTEILGKLNVNSDLRVRRSARVDQNLTVSGSGSFGSDVFVGRNLDVRNIATVRRDVRTPILRDLDDLSYYVDANNSSILRWIYTDTIASRLNTLNLRANTLDVRGKTTSEARLTGRVNGDSLLVKTQSGRYVPMTKLIPRFVHMGTVSVRNGSWVSRPSCYSGGRPKAILTTHGAHVWSRAPRNNWNSGYALGAWGARLSGSGPWRVQIRTTSHSSSASGYGIVMTYCEY